jgi:hypothetical protein
MAYFLTDPEEVSLMEIAIRVPTALGGAYRRTRCFFVYLQ